MARCFYCHVKMKPKVRARPGRIYDLEHRETSDHVFPRSLKMDREEHWHLLNKVPCCRQCNGRKGNMHPLAWLTLIRTDDKAQFLASRLLQLGCTVDEVSGAMARRKKEKPNGV